MVESFARRKPLPARRKRQNAGRSHSRRRALTGWAAEIPPVDRSSPCLIHFELFSALRSWISGFSTERFRKDSELYETRLRTAAVCHLKSNLATPQNFQGLTKLEALNLEKTQVTDVGLLHLTGMTKLESLDLSRTQITDAGLVHLKGMTNLQTLSLFSTKVTGAGIVELKQALPNCRISK